MIYRNETRFWLLHLLFYLIFKLPSSLKDQICLHPKSFNIQYHISKVLIVDLQTTNLLSFENSLFVDQFRLYNYSNFYTMPIQRQIPYKEISWPKIKIQAKELSVNSIHGIYMQKRLSNNSKQKLWGPWATSLTWEAKQSLYQQIVYR